MLLDDLLGQSLEVLLLHFPNPKLPRPMNDPKTVALLHNLALQTSHTPTQDLGSRINHLELAARYLFCAAILAGEISWPELCRVIHQLEEGHKTALSAHFDHVIAQATRPSSPP